jgi:CheY-like chemotaxis protein
MEFALSGSTIKAACEIAEDLWLCNFDPNQIGQAIDNIIINAKQATRPGGVFEVRVENRMLTIGDSLPLPPGEYVCVTVRDHGEGITPEHLPKIFDPFFSTKKGGYGLGLATSWSIVKRHDGFIDVESTGKKGTAFFVYLPASRTGKAVEERKREVPLRGRGRLLLMDDEGSLRETGAQLLRSLGYRVVVAREGKEAVELFAEARKKKRPFDLVILDLTVKGGMGGKDALASIYKKDNTVLAIASSGYSEDPIMADPRSYGFAASVRKPYRKEEIGEAVALLLAPSGKRSNAESPV